MCPTALKSGVGGKPNRSGMGSGESDFEENVEEGKRGKNHRGGVDHDPALRYGNLTLGCVHVVRCW